MEYVKDTKVTDTTPPPAPTNVRVQGNKLTWEAEADLESGLASFIIERDGQFLANVPEQGKNPFGRPIFQNLQYSDTPTQPLVPMQFTDTKAEPGKKHTYRVIAVNTVGLEVEAQRGRGARGNTAQTVTRHGKAELDRQAARDLRARSGRAVPIATVSWENHDSPGFAFTGPSPSSSVFSNRLGPHARRIGS